MMRKLATLIALSALAFTSHQAWSSPLAPQAAWKVGAIQAKSQDGRAFCSMKGAYDGGVSLVFARDASGSNSLAIELTVPTFAKGTQYPARLWVDSVSRDKTALAAGEKVLVVQMGADDAFYDMLARKDVLSVASPAANFEFDLKGSSKALLALDNCAANLDGSRVKSARSSGALPPVFSGLEAGPEASPFTRGDTVIKVMRAVPPQPVEEFNAVENAVSSLEVERLKAENRALEMEKRASEERLRAAELAKAHTNEIASRENALRAENEKLQAILEQTRRQTQEQEDLKRRLSDLEGRNKEILSSRQQSDASQAAAQELQAENQKLQAVLAKTQGDAAEQESLKLRLADLEQRNKEFLGLQEQTFSSQMRARELQAENERLQVALAQKSEGDEAARQDLQRRLAELERVKSENLAQAAATKRIENVRQEAPVIAASTTAPGVTDSWRSGDVFGAAEEYPWPEGQDFKAVAQDYIAIAGEKCRGDFAFTLGDVGKTQGADTVEAEIACIDGENDSAAALLFVKEAGKLTVITHEAPAGKMTAALEHRARTLAAVR